MSDFRAVVGEGGVTRGTLLLWPGKNLRTGEGRFKAQFDEITTLESDLLRVASAIYACDLAFKRGEREDVARTIELTIPAINYHLFKPLTNDIELTLWLLSDDNWTLRFKRAEGISEGARQWPHGKGKTVLFSGGVDSFTAALELIEATGVDSVHLASHFTANLTTRNSQQQLFSYIAQSFGKPAWTAIRTGGRKTAKADFPSDQQREDTQRTRSFMFLVIAALAARRSGHHDLVMIAENGQMAIHLPLSAARIGAFSTHTAHPEFVRKMAEFLSNVLDTQLTLSNPYLYLTKAEVVSRIATKHAAVLPKTVSCWRASRVSKFNHCGECIPCLIRRIAFESNSIELKEYERDLLNEDVLTLSEGDEGKRNLVELMEFAYAFSTEVDAALEQLFPSLINDDVDMPKAIEMYRRFATEASVVMQRYKGVSTLTKLKEKS